MLINCQELNTLIKKNDSIHIFDCRFDIRDPDWGKLAYSQGHIPGAIYVDTQSDLSGTKNAQKGRHPLPTPKQWALTRENLGIGQYDTIIIYDQSENIYACRMWWMLKSTGHTNIKLLDGGFSAWKSSGGSIETQNNIPSPIENVRFEETPFDNLVLMEDLQNQLHDANLQIIDARAANRFSGDFEPLDPVGGHIPGAKNRHYQLNLNEDGFFKSPDQLKKEFSEFTHRPNIVHQCGSGITACHNFFAMELAGLKGTKVYPGSWSEWCNHPENPVSRGD
jgi:thiosulfate/3-mercaptopyruvate sulfurtransferase